MQPLTDPATYCLAICAICFGLAALASLAAHLDGRIAARRANRMLDANTEADEWLAQRVDQRI